MIHSLDADHVVNKFNSYNKKLLVKLEIWFIYKGGIQLSLKSGKLNK